MRRRLFPLLLLLGFVLGNQLALFAQEKRTSGPVYLEKIVRQDGWKIPDTNEWELVQQVTRDRNGIPVTSTGYGSPKPFYIELESYFLDADNTLIKKTAVIEVKAIGVFSVNEKIYAYFLVGSPGGVGCLLSVFYFDEDGDGKFETQYNTEMSGHIPAWVTRDMFPGEPPPVSTASPR